MRTTRGRHTLSRVQWAGLLALGLLIRVLACGNSMHALPPEPAASRAIASTGVLPESEVAALASAAVEGQLTGWIHAAVHGPGLYVFTYRRPDDFFASVDFPLTPATDEVARRLSSLKRHDAVRVRGQLISNPAPIRHLRLEDFELLRPYVPDEAAAPRRPVTRIPEDLREKRELIGKVHAVASDGRMLVIEYGDAVVPVFVADPTLTAGLFRNDKIRLAFTIAPRPPRPTHLWLDTGHPRPLQVLERLRDRHGQSIEAQGKLVRFPVSPQITLDVYAVQVTDADGITREYTLLSEDPEVFADIRGKLAQAWKARPGAVDGRNKLVNPTLRVQARGRFNIVDRNQANAQILLDSSDDVTVTVQP